jgi:hypothetical protein
LDECVFIGIMKTMCLFFNLYHSLKFSCFILHVRDRNESASGPTPCWLDDDDDDDDDDDGGGGGGGAGGGGGGGGGGGDGGGSGGGVLFTELHHTDTKSHFNCSRVWKVPTSNYGSPSKLFIDFFT